MIVRDLLDGTKSPLPARKPAAFGRENIDSCTRPPGPFLLIRTQRWHHLRSDGTSPDFDRSTGMSKKPIQIEVVEEADERFLVRTYADGSKERLPIVQQPPRQKRMSAKIVWYWDMKTGRRKFY